MVHTWQAKNYDLLKLPHLDWGEKVISRLGLLGHEAVLDAGAGTGRDTLKVAELLPYGHVYAVDSSAEMLSELRDKIRGRNGNISIFKSDLSEPLEIEVACDAVMSVATFHWIHDHQKLFANLATTMKPGAKLIAECGGFGNIARASWAFKAVTGIKAGTTNVWNFATADETTHNLVAAGFEEIDVSLIDDPVRFPSSEEHEAFLATVIFGAQLEAIDPAFRVTTIQQISMAIGGNLVDYVRLQLSARKRS